MSDQRKGDVVYVPVHFDEDHGAEYFLLAGMRYDEENARRASRQYWEQRNATWQARNPFRRIARCRLTEI